MSRTAKSSTCCRRARAKLDVIYLCDDHDLVRFTSQDVLGISGTFCARKIFQSEKSWQPICNMRRRHTGEQRNLEGRCGQGIDHPAA